MNKLTLIAALLASLATVGCEEANTSFSTEAEPPSIVTAPVADWIYLPVHADNKWYLDSNSFRTMPSGYKRAVMRVDYSDSETAKTGIIGARILMEFDCNGGRSRYIQTYLDEGDLSPFRDVTSEETTKWFDNAPETVRQILSEIMCNE